MSLIEGIGDEVTLIIGLLTFIALLLVAWFSTHTREIPFFSVIVVELSQRASGRREQQTPGTARPSAVDVPSSTARENDGNSTQPTEESSTESINVPSQVIKIDRKQDQSDVQAVSVISTESSDNSEGVVRDTELVASAQDVQGFSDSSLPEKSTSDSRSPDPALSEEQTVPSTNSPSSQREGHRSAESDTSASTSVTTDVNNGGEEIDEHEGQIRIRLKYLNDTQRLVYSSPRETIGQFRRAHFSSELAANKLVRLIFNGQDMRNDTSTLQGYNITDNSVVHCLVTQNIQGNARQQFDQGEGDIQLGSFMLPLFALILVVMWYLRLTQRQYFNAISTLSLAGVTFLFLLGCASAWRGGAANREHQHVD